jgi:hypothetical protein
VCLASLCFYHCLLQVLSTVQQLLAVISSAPGMTEEQKLGLVTTGAEMLQNLLQAGGQQQQQQHQQQN